MKLLANNSSRQTLVTLALAANLCLSAGCGAEDASSKAEVPSTSTVTGTSTNTATGATTTGFPATGGTTSTASNTTSTTLSSSTGSGGTSSVGTSDGSVATSGGITPDCDIIIDTYELSPDIPTVGIVTWSATATIESAEIVFGPSDTGMTMAAPVDLTKPNYRTLLLGMKEQRDYDFQVVASSGGRSCSSETLTLTTGFVPNEIPLIDREVMNAAAVSPGFIVTALNTAAFALIFDADGEVVWWAKAPTSVSRARMDWNSENMWMVPGNPNPTGRGEVWRVSMDGSTTNKSSGIDVHHDLAPLPNGNVVVMAHQNDCSAILELAPELSVARTIVADVSTLYQPAPAGCHPNSILYHPEDESFTVSDREPNLYVKLSKAGELEWQFGGANPRGRHIEQTWSVNHGHHFLPNRHFLFFNNNGDEPGFGNGVSHFAEFELDVDALTATEVFRYVSANNLNSATLGDVQRLSNGNTLITYSNTGVIHEIDTTGALVQVFTTEVLGYAMHRESLYGPPPK